MKRKIDFKCRYRNYLGIDKEEIEKAGITLPDAYIKAEPMAVLSKTIKERQDNGFCRMPIDSFVESEAVGVSLIYDESPAGPRKKKDLAEEPENILNIGRLKADGGRLPDVFRACEILREEGETVAFEIHGCMDMLNNLSDYKKVLVMSMSKPDVMQKICNKVRDDIVTYFIEAQKYCDFFIFTDAVGGVDILGPSYSRRMVKWFTYPLLMDLMEELEGGRMIQICPQLVYSLVECGLAETETVHVEDPGKWMQSMCDEVVFVERQCGLNKLPDGNWNVKKIIVK